MQDHYSTDAQKILRVACYERVSSDEQARHGLSINAQTEALEQWVKDHGHILIGHYTDAGVSGGKAIEKRPAMFRLLQAVQDGQVDLIVFTKLDRWFRSLKNYYIAQDILDSAHCAWQAIQEDYETLTASGRFKVNIMLSVAENEREKTAERVRNVLEYRAAKGEYLGSGAAVPYGYVRKAGKLEKDPAVEDMVTDLFRIALSGISHMEAYRELKQLHPEFPKSYNGYKRILYSPIHAGIYKNQHDFCPAYLTEDEHAAIMATAGRRSPRSDRVYLFVGLLVCPECGRILVCRRSTINNKSYIHYTCSRHLYDGVCGFKRCMREDKIESALMSYIFRPAKITADPVPENRTQKNTTVKQVEQKMKRLAETYTDGLIDREAYKQRLSDLTAELETLRNAPKTLSRPPLDLAAQFIEGNTAEVYSKLSPTEKRRFWLRILRRVEMDGDYHIRSINFYE